MKRIQFVGISDTEVLGMRVCWLIKVLAFGLSMDHAIAEFFMIDC